MHWALLWDPGLRGSPAAWAEPAGSGKWFLPTPTPHRDHRPNRARSRAHACMHQVLGQSRWGRVLGQGPLGSQALDPGRKSWAAGLRG